MAADFQFCTSNELPATLAEDIKAGKKADATKLFNECLGNYALGVTNREQDGNETKNQVKSMMAAGQMVADGTAAKDLRDDVRKILGSKDGKDIDIILVQDK